MLVLLGYYLIEKDHKFSGGILFGLASLAGIYALFVFMAVLICNWKKLRILKGFLIITIPVNLVLFFVTRMDYINQVYLYHLSKPVESYKLIFLNNLFHQDLIIWLPFIVFGVVLILTKDIWNPYLAIIALSTAFILSLGKPFNYYMIIVYPFMALFIASGMERFRNIKAWIALGMVIFCVVMIYQVSSNIDNFHTENKFGKFSYVTRYFQNKEGPVFGDFTITTLVALGADKDVIVSKSIDTYPLAIRSIGIKKMLREVSKQQPRYILIHKISGTMNPLWKTLEMRKFMESYCDLDKEWKENKNEYLIYRCSY